MMAATHPSTRGFLDLWEHVHAKSGLAFAEGQLKFLSRRVQPRLLELGIKDYSAYLERVREDEHELALLLDAVTVNDTAFNREPGPFRPFVDLLVPTLLDRLPRPLRVWSAGCATGEEPYTLGMLLLDRMGGDASKQVDLLATDISGRAVAQASCGIYRAAAVEQLPRAWRDSYFRPHADGYRVTDELRSLVRFEQGNLQQEQWPADTRDRDVIFCRNVMIYFSQGVRREVAARLHAALSPGGYLILGTRESLHDVGRQFTHQYVGNSLYYYKQPPG
jgi:chemotaxis protein methyltransferase CheR